MNNLMQFKDRPEEFTEYLKDVKGINIDENSGIVKTFLIIDGVMIAIFGGLWLYNHYRNRENENNKNKY